MEDRRGRPGRGRHRHEDRRVQSRGRARLDRRSLRRGGERAGVARRSPQGRSRGDGRLRRRVLRRSRPAGLPRSGPGARARHRRGRDARGGVRRHGVLDRHDAGAHARDRRGAGRALRHDAFLPGHPHDRPARARSRARGLRGAPQRARRMQARRRRGRGRRDRARLRRHGRPDRRGPEGGRRPRHRRRRRRGEVRRGSGGHGSSDEQGRRSRVAVAQGLHGCAGAHGRDQSPAFSHADAAR